MVSDLMADTKINLRAADILESITDAFMAFDSEWRFVYVNDQSEKVMARTREELLGQSFWDEFPATVGSTFEREYRRAVREQVTVAFEEFYAPLNIWVEVRAYPSSSGLSVFYQDVTVRKQKEVEREKLLAEQHARAERESLLNRIGQALRASLDSERIQETAAALAGKALGADRCYFSVYDPQKNAVQISRDWHRPGLPSVAGEYSFSGYQEYVEALYASGTAIVPDAQHPDVPPVVQQVLGSFGIRAFLAVPLLEEGKFAAALAASMSGQPRAWTPEEIALMEAVLTQTQTAVAAARQRQRERRFVRDVLASVTDGKLRLCDTEADLPVRLTPDARPILISITGGLRELRQATHQACRSAGLSEERCHDLVTAANEAGMNAAVHAGAGTGQVSTSEKGTVQVRVEDHGTGISMENLPRAALSRGFSTKATLGHGLKMMLQTADRLFLLTGPGGTTVVMEQDREAPFPSWA